MSVGESSTKISVPSPGVSGSSKGSISSGGSSAKGQVCYTNSNSRVTACVYGSTSTDRGSINPSSVSHSNSSYDTSDKGRSMGISFSFRFK